VTFIFSHAFSIHFVLLEITGSKSYVRLAYVCLIHTNLIAMSYTYKFHCLQCFDAVGWVARRASGL